MPGLVSTLTSRARRALDPRWRRGGLVLAYHRVADLEHDPQRLAVTPAAFAAHLDIIRRYGTPMPLASLVKRAHAGTLPRNAVAVTFDDGYDDVLNTAAPLLARFSVPATVFVTTDPIEHGGEFWWDSMGRLLLSPGTLPRRFHIDLSEGPVEYDLNEASTLTPAAFAVYARWTVEDRATPTPRHRVYRDLCRRLRREPAAVRGLAVDALTAEWRSSGGAPAASPMRPDGVAALHATAGIDVGSHTRTHPSLVALDLNQRVQEVEGGRRRLEQWTGARAVMMAFPFGGRADVSADVVETVRRSGMTVGCTTEPGRVNEHTDPLRVPRVVVRNWSACEFHERWQDWTRA